MDIHCDEQLDSVQFGVSFESSVSFSESLRDQGNAHKLLRSNKGVERPLESVSLFQLENMRKVVALKLTLKVTIVNQILDRKIVGKLGQAFSAIRRAEKPSHVAFFQRNMIINLATSFVNKVSHVFKTKVLNHSGYFIRAFIEKKFCEEDLLEENRSQVTMTAEKTNKLLRKKLQKKEKEKTDICTQFDQLLSIHEAILRK